MGLLLLAVLLCVLYAFKTMFFSTSLLHQVQVLRHATDVQKAT